MKARISERQPSFKTISEFQPMSAMKMATVLLALAFQKKFTIRSSFKENLGSIGLTL